MRKELFLKITSSLQGTFAMTLITSRPVSLGQPEEKYYIIDRTNNVQTILSEYVFLYIDMCVLIPEKSAGSTLTLKAQMKIFPSSKVTRIHTIGASRALWSIAENRYLQGDQGPVFILTFYTA